MSSEKISRPASRSKTQQERNRLQQSCTELQLDSVPKLKDQPDYPAWRDSAVFTLKTFNCWKIVEGTESEPTSDDIKDEDVLLDAIDRFGSRYRWASVFFLDTAFPPKQPT